MGVKCCCERNAKRRTYKKTVYRTYRLILLGNLAHALSVCWGYGLGEVCCKCSMAMMIAHLLQSFNGAQMRAPITMYRLWSAIV
jgi:hypothetical protein